MKNQLDSILDSFCKEFSLSGYDCAVVKDGKEIYRRICGLADIQQNIPLTRDTLYNIYSNTKVITCVAALQLFEKGHFKLDDPLYRFFPRFKDITVKQPDGAVKKAEKPILIKDLFCMTAGFGDGDDYLEIGAELYKKTGGSCYALQLADALCDVPLLFEPSSEYRYGICHELLAALIEKLTDMRFSEYLQKNIFSPLDMNNTSFDIKSLDQNNLANQYYLNKETKTLESRGTTNCLVPPIFKESASGGLISTVDDYMKFQQALARGTVLLKRATIDLMRKNHLNTQQLEGYGHYKDGLGYGLGVRAVLEPGCVGPFGWAGASGSYGLIDPENQLCVFYMQHVFGTPAGKVREGINKTLYEYINTLR